uniref:Uncharacterized protein n=1 Tax=Ralstonia solanacearum TaxID=305 RepID=A0A0S4WWG8_RALSL|nr:protein of unknown function [Ralstonia solanacearum]
MPVDLRNDEQMAVASQRKRVGPREPRILS